MVDSLPDERAPSAENLDHSPLRKSLVRLLAQLDRPCTEAELQAAWPGQAEERSETALVRMGERLGLRVRLERVRRGKLADLPTPCLLLGRRPEEAWLVRGRSGQRLILVDPETGEATAHTPRSVAALGHRIALIRPLEERLAKPAGLWEHLGSRFWPALVQVGLASVFLNLLALATPIFMMTVYNKVINHAALATLDVLAIGMLTLFAFELLLRALRAHVASHTGAKLDVAMGGEIVHRLLGMSYRNLSGTSSVGITERLRQLDQVRGFMTGQLPLLLVDLAFVGLFLIALFMIAPTLGWITLGAIPLFLLVSVLAYGRQRALTRAHGQAAAAKSALLHEAFGQALSVKAMGLEPAIERRLERRLVTSAWSAYQASSLTGLVGGSGQTLQSLTALALIYVGAKEIVAGNLTVGAMVAGSILSARAIAPMRQLFGSWGQLQQAREAFAKLAEVMGSAPESTVGGMSSNPIFKGRMTLEGVSFRYAPERPPVLDRVDLEIEPGTMFAVVGPPGSGKSTLIKLLLGLETPDSGRVLIDGQDLKQVSPIHYRGQIGVVPQEVQLFSGTIAENIAMGSTDRSFSRIIAAAKFVGLHDIVQRLPESYETMLGERGSGLSMGQRQLVSLARAIVRNPRILVLDEATSALDTASEQELLTNLRRAGSGRTIILVTHRAQVLQSCDRAAYLENGRIVRVGAPTEVMAAASRPPARESLQAVP